MKNIFTMIACGLLLGCKDPAPGKDMQTGNIEKQVKEMKSRPVTIEELEKRSLGEAVTEYGQPLNVETFILDDALPESRVELNNHFTIKERRSESISVKETVWEKDGETNITAWYRENQSNWVLVHALEWEKGSEF